MTNMATLKDAGVISAEAEKRMTDEDYAAIETLSADEVEYMISGGLKLGKDFFDRLGAHGIYF